MTQVLGILLGVGLLAIIIFLPREEWPPAPKWMRLTAVAIALPLAVVAVLAFKAGCDARDNSTLVYWLVALLGGIVALKLLVWAWIGRVNPRSLLALALPASQRRAPWWLLR